MIQTSYKRPTTGSGELRTPVSFYRNAPNDGPEPGETVLNQLYECYAQVYAPSNKDRQILNDHDTSRAVTIKIRDSRGQYVANNDDVCVIDDYRYIDSKGNNIVWNVIDVRPDFEDDKFVVIVLGVITS
ncbi:phage head-tail adapter protein [Pediococcus inopinatus]|uniref:phage head-tail adapter protein n=1 Tax=Pediococcus inopinatus TaxID=114090 RepID=UPI000A741EA0|nr:phage head-tail adapter protein [Pediococcus inopinatus]